MQFPERKAPTIFENLNDEKAARMGDRYNVSKLLEVFACREIAKHCPQSQLNVTLNFVNPGFCHSELMRNMDNIGLRVLKAMLCRSTEMGSRTLVHAGVGIGPESHGKFLSDCKIEKCAKLVEGPEGPELQRRVWAELSQALEHIQPGITKALDA